MNAQALAVTSIHRLHHKTVLKGFGSGFLLLLLFSICAFADTHYVSLSGSHTAPFTDWATAATNIQAAIDVASAGETVLVTNGVYATGGAFSAALTNRVVITNAVTVRSVNGPDVTTIQGQGPMGADAVRCAYVADGAKLVGFTLTNGFTDNRLGEFVVIIGQGGGIYCNSAAGVVSNCILTGNSASYGGGACNGTLYNCILTGNWAYYGGGSFNCTLYNCTLTGNGNSATWHGGGAFFGTLYNCIVYYNTSPEGPNYSGGCIFNYSCTTPDPGGIGNITNNPRFVNVAAGDYHLQATSPCINAGTHQNWMIGATDLDGNPRLYAGGRVDMGAYEYQGMSLWSNTTAPTVVDVGPDSAVELGVKFRSDVEGTITGIRFYKADANTGAHVGNLWTSGGMLLATVIFSNETASGWQQALFATPVTIASNTVYVASYHASNGHYSEDDYYFQGKGVDNPPLHALADGVSGGNSVYAYGSSSAFPNQTWNAANYWADVVFQVAPLVITTTSLPNGVMNQAYTETLTAIHGTLPYTWSIISGSLPLGLTLNSGSGVISGTPTASGIFNFTVQVKDSGSPAQTATQPLSISVVMSIWSSTMAPTVVDAGPDSAVELGVKFRSDVTGTITGIRFYKANANTGAHVGNLWTTNGTRLATVLFSNETASGWQQALFATPVTIASNTVYVASYHASSGHYSEDDYYFRGKGVDNPPLHALADGVSGGNSVYAYGSSSAFPNQTWNAANYWVDVVFLGAPLVITTTSLSNGVMNEAYTETLTAIHGTLPYTWSIISGSLPLGLTLNSGSGVISGTPTASGIFNFTVQVKDSGSPAQTATKPLSISVVMSIWSNTTAPTVVDAGPDSAVELGVKFRSDVTGTIAGIRFYKADANTGAHVGNLWASDGTLLATVTLLQRDCLGMAAGALCHAGNDCLQYGLRGLLSRQQWTLQRR